MPLCRWQGRWQSTGTLRRLLSSWRPTMRRVNALCVLAVTLTACVVTGLDTGAPPVNVWKAANSSRPWQNPVWGTTSSHTVPNTASPKASETQNQEWPSLSGPGQATQQPRLTGQTASYSNVLTSSNQGTQSTTVGSSIQHVSNRNRGSENHRRTTPATPVSQNRTQITDHELTTLSEKLFDDDASDTGKNVKINYQSRTQSNSYTDEAPKPLLAVDKDILNNPTVKALYQLYDNYIADISFVESVTAQERQEEGEFLNKVLETRVMREAMDFLANKGYVARSDKAYKELLNLIWFTMYSRGGGIIGSSAFEHVFLGELKRDDISGLHNWIYFATEEEKQRVDYMGYLKKLDLGKKSYLLKVHYRWSNVIKPSGSMFVGTSPELEMALYTVCFLTRPNDRCPLSLGGKTFGIQTYTYRINRNRGTVIGSAYPVF